ncbi:YbaK/EbsC family protein [Micrococcales bacterium 31B]|nr:YbaK/EbsC family protein [Micrococcales bacterium 31B]
MLQTCNSPHRGGPRLCGTHPDVSQVSASPAQYSRGVRGKLDWKSPSENDLTLPASVRAAAATVPGVEVAQVDPDLADTAAFCAAYEVPLQNSANCVIVAGKRGGETTYAAVMVLATMRADVNGVVRKELGARKASFAPMEEAVTLTGMEYGGITPLGLPPEWEILIDSAVLAAGDVVIGAGIRGAKILLPAASLLGLPNAREVALASEA